MAAKKKPAKKKAKAKKKVKAKAKPKLKAKAKAKAKPKKKAKRKPKGEIHGNVKYKADFARQARDLTLLGAIDLDLAAFFKVVESTLYKWKLDHPKFEQAITSGKDMANAKVVASLYERSLGYSHPEEKIFMDDGKVVRVKTTKHYPPCSKSISLFLRNRTAVNGAIGMHWKEQQEQVITPGEGISFNMNFGKAEEKNDE